MQRGKIAGDGYFSKTCEAFLCDRYGFKKAFLTTSCTDALELSAMLVDIQPGDEVIMPSYTFVSMANAFVIHGAKIVFADSASDSPNVDVSLIEALITPRTKAIITVHYGGIASNVIELKRLADKHNIYLVEDAAHSIDSFYEGKPLGTYGHLAAFSFHETKNISCGEGGLLAINYEPFVKRAEIIREKGTNRSSFVRGEVAKYNWVDVGSSFLPSDMLAAFLYAQLQKLDEIQSRRKEIWNYYYNNLCKLEEQNLVKLPQLPQGTTQNGHIFYLVCKDINERSAFIDHMKRQQVSAVFHYMALHNSPYYKEKYDGRQLPNAERYEECLVRLPLFYDLSWSEVEYIVKHTKNFFAICY